MCAYACKRVRRQDIVCRYAHQTGHYVPRRFGWDCHGLPVEFEIDKKLGITGREDVRRPRTASCNCARGVCVCVRLLS